ncbi:MAG: hypothetical protein B7Z16_05550 [Algoriphagus sp. 32-45-6]|jgi:hypothetical protein|nr:MAG: hypothetical protein B7Z16_05550 [Algoriphagus sp. 32-45-6]
MNEELIKLLGIYLLSMFKFIAGPVLGSAAGYSFWKILLITTSAMMTSVFTFTLIGTKLKQWTGIKFKTKRPVFSNRSRRIVLLWKKYGEAGIAFFTPLLLTPVGGTLILVSFGTKKRRIYFHMLWSALLWSTIFGLSIKKILQIPFFQVILG